MVGVESATCKLEETDLENGMGFRAACADALRKATLPKPNLIPKTRKILLNLSKNEQLVVTTADKGGRLVVLDSNQYSEMCMVHLQDKAYERVTQFGSGRGTVFLRDRPGIPSEELLNECFSELDASDKLLRLQCSKLTKLLISLTKSKQMTAQECRQLIPGQPYSGTLSKFYGLPKIHKVGKLKIRPIISTTGLYSDSVMFRLKAVLNCLIWGTTVLSNSYEFIQLLHQFTFSHQDKLLSFDVESLFTRVPVQESLRIIENCLHEMSLLPEDLIRDVTSMTDLAIMKLL